MITVFPGELGKPGPAVVAQQVGRLTADDMNRVEIALLHVTGLAHHVPSSS